MLHLPLGLDIFYISICFYLYNNIVLLIAFVKMLTNKSSIYLSLLKCLEPMQIDWQ